jgi:hypothetical protein
MVGKQSSFRKNRFQAPGPSSAQKKSTSKRELLSFSLTVLSLLGTALTLVGYGVALSVDQFGIPPESLFSSPFEIISLSVWGVLQFFTSVSKISFLAYYRDVLSQLLPILVGGFIAIGSVYFFARLQPHVERIRQRRPRLAKYVAPPKREDGPAIFSLKLLAYFLLFWLTLPALYLGTAVLFTVTSFLLAMAPYMGIAAGNAHIKKDVLAPTACLPLYTREQRLNPDPKVHPTSYANCISIKTDRMQQDLRGRVIFTTSSSVVLFDPDTGIATRMMIKDATIQAIDSLRRNTTNTKLAPPSPSE